MKSQLCIAVAVALLTTGQAFAAVSATVSSGDKSAQAVFDRTADGRMVIRVSNLSGSDLTRPRDLLTAVYFDTDQSLSLNYVGTATREGSHVVNGADRVNISSEWTLSGRKKLRRQTGAMFGLGAANLGGFFKGVGNIDFGLTSAGDDPDTGGKKLRNRATVQNEIIIVLSGLPEDFDPTTDITEVMFQFGGKKKGMRLVGELAASVEELDTEANRVSQGPAAASLKSDPVASPSPSALVGGLVLMGLLAARRRRQRGAA